MRKKLIKTHGKLSLGTNLHAKKPKQTAVKNICAAR